ncbi:MAG: phosphate regulon sensor histidine kinase PhoR [Methyloprofundus sp.]|nr:phosphate regulon sensor histidine kinase PhoR [Methyloprofundus sp.]
MSFLRNDLFHLFLAIALVALVSHYTGYFLYLLLFILSIYILQQAILIKQIRHWLKSGAKTTPPPYNDLWNDIDDYIVQNKKSTKKRKKQLSRIIEQFRKSTSALPDAVVILGEHNDIIWFNQAATKLLGLNKKNTGLTISTFIQETKFADFLQNKDPDAVLGLQSPINEQLSLQLRLVTYDDNAHLLVAHDISYLKNIERMRKNFVDNISHELRTPLTVLKGYLETLNDLEEQQSPLLSHSLQQMDNQTLRMQNLVDELLVLADLETKKIHQKCVDIRSLLAQICQESGALEQSDNRVELFLNTKLNILGNEQELRSAFTNLIVNALKYSPEDAVVTVQWHQLGDSVILEVTDLGEGIPELEIPKITERFYRVEAQRTQKQRGTGLGLAIVKHVLVRHDAHLEIHSQVGKGSRFSCLFPKQRFC